VPVAFVARSDEALTAEALLALCRARLAGYKRDSLRTVRAIPAQHNGEGAARRSGAVVKLNEAKLGLLGSFSQRRR
jgi:hypothetical protein